MAKAIYDQLLEHDDKQIKYWTDYKNYYKALGARDYQIEINYANKQLRRIKKLKKLFLEQDRANWL